MKAQFGLHYKLIHILLKIPLDMNDVKDWLVDKITFWLQTWINFNSNMDK